jgi:hypothetical protein
MYLSDLKIPYLLYSYSVSIKVISMGMTQLSFLDMLVTHLVRGRLEWDEDDGNRACVAMAGGGLGTMLLILTMPSALSVLLESVVCYH